MERVTEIIAATTAWIWGIPMLVLLVGGGLFLTVRLGFFQVRYMPHILRQTFGKMFGGSEGEGSVTSFQAVTSALSSTVGATNIVGVPVAIALGGPGAVFWMWAVALVGMASKYSEVVLGVKYRETNADGDYVGGPMYYIDKGLGWKPVAGLFATGVFLFVIPSTMVQSNSVSTLLQDSFTVPGWVTGLVIAGIVGLITVGGIKRIGRVAEKAVPFMVSLYLIGAVGVMVINFTEIPQAFSLIFVHAFTPISAAGGFAGAGVAAALRFGLARGTYSNEAGMGSAPMAHSAARVSHPSQQGIWGVFEVIVDTWIILTLTSLLVLTSGTWRTLGVDQAPSMVSQAFGQLVGPSLGNIFLSVALFLFVITTVTVIVYYGEKGAEYLFGTAFSKVMRLVYLVAIVLGAIGGLRFVWQFLDLILVLVIVPNMIAVLLLSGEVRELTKDYFSRLKQGRIKQGNEPESRV